MRARCLGWLATRSSGAAAVRSESCTGRQHHRSGVSVASRAGDVKAPSFILPNPPSVGLIAICLSILARVDYGAPDFI
jgi:hypothetical protein